MEWKMLNTGLDKQSVVFLPLGLFPHRACCYLRKPRGTGLCVWPSPKSLCRQVEPEGRFPGFYTQPSFQHLPFTQRLTYPTSPPPLSRLPIALHVQANKVLCYLLPLLPPPQSQLKSTSANKKRKSWRFKPGTHLANGTLVNKKVTYHELLITPWVILNPLLRKLSPGWDWFYELWGRYVESLQIEHKLDCERLGELNFFPFLLT